MQLFRNLEFRQEVPFSEINNKILLTNPLYFHGMNMQALIKTFFLRIDLASRIMKVYKAWERYTKDSKYLSSQDLPGAKPSKLRKGSGQIE